MPKNTLSRKASILLVVGMFNTAATSLAVTFINIFFLRANSDGLSLVILQNIMNYAVLLITFVAGTKLLSRLGLSGTLRLGIFISLLYYIIILLLRRDLSLFIVPLGIFSGLGNGLYWLATNLLIGDLVGEESQGAFFSYQQMISALFGIFVPALSGFVIVHFGGLSGYYLLFGCAVIIFLIGIMTAQRLPNVKVSQKMHVLPILRLKKNRYWQANRLQNFSSGFKGALNNLFFVLFAYAILKHENVIGNLTSFQGAISAVSAFVFARFFKKRYQKNVYFIVCLFSLLTFCTLALFPHLSTLVAAFVIFGLIQSWGYSISSSITYQLSTRAGSSFSQREYLVATEFPIAAGRIGGLLFALALVMVLPDVAVYRVLFVAIGLMWMIEFIFIDKKVAWLTDEEKNLNA